MYFENHISTYSPIDNLLWHWLPLYNHDVLCEHEFSFRFLLKFRPEPIALWKLIQQVLFDRKPSLQTWRVAFTPEAQGSYCFARYLCHHHHLQDVRNFQFSGKTQSKERDSYGGRSCSIGNAKGSSPPGERLCAWLFSPSSLDSPSNQRSKTCWQQKEQQHNRLPRSIIPTLIFLSSCSV